MPTTRGLPGFLRRSLRVDYDDDEDDEEEEDEEEAEQAEAEVINGDSVDEQEEDTRAEGTALSLSSAAAAPSKSASLDSCSEEEEEEIVAETERNLRMSGSDDTNNGSQTSGQQEDEKPPANNNSQESDDSAGAEESSAKSRSVSFTNNNRSKNTKNMVKKELSDSWQEVPRNDTPSPMMVKKEKSYRESQFDKIMLKQDVVNMGELRKLAWNGIPSTHRADAWKILLGYVPTNQKRRQASLDRKRAEYRDAMAQHYDIDDDTRTLQEQETLRQVLVDVPRTAPEVPLFRNDRIRRILSRLLYIWAMRHPASSYVQGINDLATPLLVVFLADYFEGEDVLDGHVMNHLSEERLDELEADVYWSLTNLLAGIQDHYTSDQPGVQRMVMRLQELVQRIDADLCNHLAEMGIEFLQFSFKWMNCLLLREFSLRCVIRLWDTYISEKDGFEGFHVYVCAAFLCQFSQQLQAMSFDELFGFMQGMPTADWGTVEIEMLLSQAYVLSTLFGGSDAHLTSGSTNR